MSCGAPTVEDGNVTLFIVAEHWNADGLGWHVAQADKHDMPQPAFR